MAGRLSSNIEFPHHMPFRKVHIWQVEINWFYFILPLAINPGSGFCKASINSWNGWRFFKSSSSFQGIIAPIFLWQLFIEVTWDPCLGLKGNGSGNRAGFGFPAFVWRCRGSSVKIRWRNNWECKWLDIIQYMIGLDCVLINFILIVPNDLVKKQMILLQKTKAMSLKYYYAWNTFSPMAMIH